MKCALTCRYCGSPTIITLGDKIYPHLPQFHCSKYYLCPKCGAYVGSNSATGKPLGEVADKQLRAKRQQTHKIFDELWKSGRTSRSKAYKWLSNKMGLSSKDCHIGLFDEELCQKVINICLSEDRNDRTK